MSRGTGPSLLVLSLGLLAFVVPAGLAADGAGTCRERCAAEQRECLASAACTTGSAAEQKECRRVCERTYTLCAESCG